MKFDSMTDIRDSGAVGDGRTINTTAIQQALDACSAAGGGTVLVPPGVFVSGTLYLRDRVRLHLERGAVLLASPDAKDYNADDAFPQNVVFRREAVSGAHFILGIGVSEVTISGDGAIDGNDACFRGPLVEQEGAEPHFAPSEWRPGQMIYFCESRDIRVEDVTIRHSPYWHLFLHGCADVRIRGLRIHTDRRTRNGDGIDIDCCTRVTVSDCLIDTSDDCITVRANGKTLLNTPMRSEGIAVSNCVLRSRTCGVRVGVGSGSIRQASFSNLVMRDVQSGIHVQGRYSAASDGVDIRSIRFNNVSIDGRVAIHITSGFEGRKPLKGIFISNVDARCDATSYIGGSPLQPVEDIHLDNVHLTFHGGKGNTADQPSPYECYRTATSYSRRAIGMPYGIFVEDAAGLRMRRMTIRWEDIDGLWRRAIRCRRIRDAEFREMVADTPPGGEAQLETEEAQDVVIRECRGLG